MSEITLITTYGFIYLKNPTRFWVRENYMSAGYQLRYSDDKWEHNTIYSGYDAHNLLDIRDYIVDEIAKGKTTINLRQFENKEWNHDKDLQMLSLWEGV